MDVEIPVFTCLQARQAGMTTLVMDMIRKMGTDERTYQHNT